MTVTTQISAVTHVGNGITTEFELAGKVHEDTHVEVYLYTPATAALDGPISTSLYTVAGAGDDSTGITVTYPVSGSPLPSTREIIIRRTVPNRQDLNIKNQGGFFPNTVERQLDDLEMQIQQNTRQANMPIRPVDQAIAQIDVASGGIINGPTLSDLQAAASAAAVVQRVATRGELKALNRVAFPIAILSESNRQGVFTWETGDFSTEIADDTNEGIWLQADGVATNVGAWVRVFTGRANALWFGLDPTGVADATDILIEMFERGGEYYFPEGTYLIHADGSNGGAKVNAVTDSIDVLCHRDALFVAQTGLNRDLIELQVDTTTALTNKDISIRWQGGRFDVSAQNNSTSLAYLAQYPAANPGTNATSDCLSIRGKYTDTGVNKEGYSSVVVQDVAFYSGDHWESAGGDSHLFVDGAKNTHISDVRCIGARGAGIYVSGMGTPTTTGGERFLITNCTAENCINGFTLKRAPRDSAIIGCVTENCTGGVSLDALSERVENISITGCTFRRFWRGVRASYGEHIAITGNSFEEHGPLLESGAKPTLIFLDPCGVLLRGTIESVVSGNVFAQITPGWTQAECEGILLDEYDDGTLIDSAQDNIIVGNIFKFLNSPGEEVAGGGSSWTLFAFNHCISCTSDVPSNFPGSNSQIIRMASNSKWLTVGKLSETFYVDTDGDMKARTLTSESGVTGSRPSTGGLTAPAQWFDTTLGKPIWWDGTNWVDATGATV